MTDIVEIRQLTFPILEVDSTGVILIKIAVTLMMSRESFMNMVRVITASYSIPRAVVAQSLRRESLIYHQLSVFGGVLATFTSTTIGRLPSDARSIARQ